MSMRFPRRDLLSLLAALAIDRARAQEEGVIKVDVDLVNILCAVRDKKGAFIRDLEKADFTLTEDGRKQEIRYFSRETDLPLTIGLLVDVSKSQENLIEVERRAAAAFFRSVLRPKDLAFLISFGSDAELLQDLTGSAQTLERALRSLRLSVDPSGIYQGPIPTSGKPRGTIMYDAVMLAATEKLRGEVGRKVIVLITDGMDFGSRTTREEAIAAAQRADAIIYSIYYVDRMQYGGWGASDGDIKDEMRSQYAIGYSPTNPNKDGGFRKIDIKTRNKDLKVLARKGYFAGKD
jgi:VWFA-related protein